MKKIASAQEFSKVNATIEFSKEQLEKFEESFIEDEPTYLGIHKVYENGELFLKSHHYIGYMWLDTNQEQYIQVVPKEFDNKTISYKTMMMECLSDSTISKKLSETYEIYFNQKWIRIEDETQDMMIVVVLQFLNILDQIRRKGLKRDYTKNTSNLQGKVQGKILIQDTIKKNHLKSRFDKTVCTYEVFTENCLENRILKTALVQCSRYMEKSLDENIILKLKNNLRRFEQVEPKRVYESDYQSIKGSSFYKEYTQALELSKMILKRFGFNLENKSLGQKKSIPPFYINMEKLFKKYVELNLSKQYKSSLLALYTSINSKYKMDFLVKNKHIAVKVFYSFPKEKNMIMQMASQAVLFSRDNDFKTVVGILKEKEVFVKCIFPLIDGKLNRNILNNFSNLAIESCELPLNKF